MQKYSSVRIPILGERHTVNLVRGLPQRQKSEFIEPPNPLLVT